MARHYGPDSLATIELEITKMTDFAISETDQSVALSISVNVRVFVVVEEDFRDLAVDINIDNIRAVFAFKIDQMRVSANLLSLQLSNEDMTLQSCAWPNPKLNLIQQLAQDFLDPETDVLADLNAYIAENVWLELPDQIGGLFKLSELTIAYHNDYLFIGATPAFIASAQTDHEDEVNEIPEFNDSDSWKQGIQEAVGAVVSEETVIETVVDVAKAVEEKIPESVVDVVKDNIPSAIDWFKKHGWA